MCRARLQSTYWTQSVTQQWWQASSHAKLQWLSCSLSVVSSVLVRLSHCCRSHCSLSVVSSVLVRLSHCCRLSCSLSVVSYVLVRLSHCCRSHCSLSVVSYVLVRKPSFRKTHGCSLALLHCWRCIIKTCIETLNSEVIYTQRRQSDSSVVNVHAACKRMVTENAMERPAPTGLELRFRNGTLMMTFSEIWRLCSGGRIWPSTKFVDWKSYATVSHMDISMPTSVLNQTLILICRDVIATTSTCIIMESLSQTWQLARTAESVLLRRV